LNIRNHEIELFLNPFDDVELFPGEITGINLKQAFILFMAVEIKICGDDLTPREEILAQASKDPARASCIKNISYLNNKIIYDTLFDLLNYSESQSLESPEKVQETCLELWVIKELAGEKFR
jgi:hypothetical protein